MSDFEVKVVRIEEDPVNHPDADRLTLVKIGGYTCIAGKLEDGSPRYKKGDLVVYVPEAAILPEWLMKRDGYWDTVKDKAAFKKVKAKKLRGIFSEGLLIAVSSNHYLDRNGGEIIEVTEGDNVAEFLGITKYEPHVPASMMGVKGALYGVTKKYDFDAIEKQMKLFDEGEIVSVTEKIHGTNIQIGYVPGIDANDGEWLGFYVTSKGLGKDGYNLKISDDNKDNIYVREFLKLNDAQVLARMIDLSTSLGEPIRLYGELFGKGIQDLSYGVDPQVQFFDIQVGETYVDPDTFQAFCNKLDINSVPQLYVGSFDLAFLVSLRDGKDTITGTHMREGIVIKNILGAERKVAKWVSPDYKLRQNATEFN